MQLEYEIRVVGVKKCKSDVLLSCHTRDVLVLEYELIYFVKLLCSLSLRNNVLFGFKDPRVRELNLDLSPAQITEIFKEIYLISCP